MRKQLTAILCGAAMLLAPMATVAQTVWHETAEAKLTIAGTSTLHDWTMSTAAIKCQADVLLNGDGAPARINRLTVTLPAESLKSEKESMDRNAYKALKTDKHKNITFQLIAATVQNNQVVASGNLSISGVTNRIDLQATCTPQPDRSLRCTGQKGIKMSDYKVEPPSFMFGTVRTGDAITLSFDVKLAPAQPASNNP
jgi:polyisoprenoid-binding protein YceI